MAVIDKIIQTLNVEFNVEHRIMDVGHKHLFLFLYYKTSVQKINININKNSVGKCALNGFVTSAFDVKNILMFLYMCCTLLKNEKSQ